MSASFRQTDLFAGEVWTAIYQAWPQINFNASDPVSIATALRNYIQISYPEQYNDWIASSEFVAIIDLLSWLAGTLAYKTDLAARENFIDTAEARESILRLARFLSYNPNRCQCANDVLKITSVMTDDDVYDSFGIDLINTTVNWNDPNNSNWFEQFTAILNDAFVNTNPFGIPLSQGTVAGITTQLYRLNGLASNTSLGFTSIVSGTSMDFEVCNGDFTNGGTLFERDPNPAYAFQFYYLNDGQGNASTRTGFFLLFKQGSTQQQLFNIPIPVANQLIDLSSTNINNTDVWVQTVDDNGNVITDWTMVPAIFNSNITYNSLPADQRNIFAVITRDNDQATVRFSDGNFGNAPSGNIQVTYRVSNGLTYSINPLEIDSVQLPFSYVNTAGVSHTLTMTFSLYETVSNASAAETIESIRQRAPQVYGTQARMVSGEDYNTFPLSTNLAAKIQAVNRVYSGQSRYIDLHDPTGTYQDLSIFSEDGIFFREYNDSYFEVPTTLNQSAEQLLIKYIQPALTLYTTTNFIGDVLMQAVINGLILPPSPALVWTTASADLFATTGWFSGISNLIQPGAQIRFNVNGVPTWVAVIAISGSINLTPLAGTAGPVTLSVEVPSGSTVLAILPSSTVQPSSTVYTAVQNNLSLKLSFSLWYDFYNSNSVNGPTWVVQGPANDFGAPLPALQGTLLQVMNVNYTSGLWCISTLGMRYVFESVSAVEWYDNGNRALAQLTSEANVDLIRIMRINRDVNNVLGYALTQNYNLAIDRIWTYPNGTPEPRRTTVVLYDSTGTGYPDEPDTFYKIINESDVQDTYLFWTNTANPPYDEPLNTVTVYTTDTLMQAVTPAVGTVAFIVSSSVSYINDATFWVYTSSGWQQDLSNSYRYEIGRGPNVAQNWITGSGPVAADGDQLAFHWKHYAASDHRLDPASTNIVNIFVLTYSYDTAVRQWIANGAVLTNEPTAPTELDLSLTFSSLQSSAMFSDTIVWRPVSYKYLFGANADPSVQAQFKVIRLTNASISDGQIQSNVINAINSYFALANWNFGETFYFSELAAYIHQQLVGQIASVVIVPTASNGEFGDGFEIDCDPDEIFISTAQVSDVILIQSNTAINLRMAGAASSIFTLNNSVLG